MAGITVEELASMIRAGSSPNALRSTLEQAGDKSLYGELDGIPLISVVMIEACDEQDASALKTLLAAGLSPDFVLRPVDGYTLLMRAATANAEVVRLLLNSGADPNIQDRNGWTAMMYAVALDETSGACSASESVEIARMLLDAGAAKEQKNRRGQTARDILMLQGVADTAAAQQIAAIL